MKLIDRVIDYATNRVLDRIAERKALHPPTVNNIVVNNSRRPTNA